MSLVLLTMLGQSLIPKMLCLILMI